MYYLNEAQQQSLLLQPETGLGYQLVEVTTMARRRVIGVAYNAELVLDRDEPNRPLLFRVFAKEIPVQANGAAVREIRVLLRDSAEFREFTVGEPRAPYATKLTGAAHEAPLVTTKAGEIFRRFTAYARDRRVRPDGGLRPGTYATTAQDAGEVSVPREIIAKYALPSPQFTVHALTIRPALMTLVQYGTAQAAHGQPGGGVEVIFTEGTTLRTVTGPEKIAAR